MSNMKLERHEVFIGYRTKEIFPAYSELSPKQMPTFNLGFQSSVLFPASNVGSKIQTGELKVRNLVKSKLDFNPA